MYENEMNGIFAITRLGLNLIAKWNAGTAERIIEGIWVGDGRLDGSTYVTEMTDLINPIAIATSTVPQTVDSQIQFIAEYRNEFRPDLPGFWLNEFGVFATDPDIGRVLLLYGNLLDFPEWIPPYTAGLFNSRRFPAAIGISTDGEVSLSFPADAFMTSGDTAQFVAVEISNHNNDPEAHQNRFSEMLAKLSDFEAKISALTGLEVDGAVDDHASLLTLTGLVPGTIILVRRDETQGGISALYVLKENGEWEFLSEFNIDMQSVWDSTEMSDADIPGIGVRTHHRIAANTPNYRPFGWVDPDPPPTDPTDPPIDPIDP